MSERLDSDYSSNKTDTFSESESQVKKFVQIKQLLILSLDSLFQINLNPNF